MYRCACFLILCLAAFNVKNFSLYNNITTFSVLIDSNHCIQFQIESGNI